ncbi:MAG: T9SS type A sorting domain-containing protein [Chitinophagales bacterium]
MYSKLYLTLFCYLIFMNLASAEQGDLISYEYLDELTHEEVVQMGMNATGALTENNPDLATIIELYFMSVADQRDLDVYKVIYESVDFYDNPVQASGVLIIPKHENYICEKSFSIYGHGTMFDREAVFSRPNNWGYEFFLPVLLSAINTICAVPDYYGMGDGDGFHHHNTYKTNASSSIDLVRAGRQLCDILGVPYNDRVLPMGYSEGGTNSMGIIKMINDYGWQDEFKVRFAGCGSGAYDLSGEAYDFIINNPIYPTRQYILYLLATCENIYGNLIDEDAGESVSTYLTSPYDDLYTNNILTQNGNTGWVAPYWEDMFVPEAIEEVKQNPDHPFRVCLEKSNVYDWENPYPTYMYYCTSDEQVPPSGALKTRDVQRNYIPWFQFWQRYKILALDITLGGLIPDHGTCALPSIFLQLFFMQNNLGLSCEYTGRTSQEMKLTTTTGENIANKMVYSNSSLDLTQLMKENNLQSVEAYNLQTGNSYHSAATRTINFNENGLYLIKSVNNANEILFSWLFKMAPDYVNTSDYDPIMTNPMNQSTKIDLSLLHETVNQIAVLDKNGHEHLIINDNLDRDFVELNRTKSMQDGEYTVEIRTPQFNYPLLLKVNSLADQNEFEIYPNPVKNNLSFKMSNIQSDMIQVKVIDVQGKVMIENSLPSNEVMELNMENIAKGFYTLEITNGSEVLSKNFIKH